MTQLLPPKKEVALALLERSNVDVYLDPRAKGVVVPPQFRKEPRLILKIGLNMPVPIPDLRLDDESMSCTLSFNRSPFYCVVPWPSVFAMVGEDGRGMVWPDDVPQELAVKVVDPGSDARMTESSTASPSTKGRAARKAPAAVAGSSGDDAKDSGNGNGKRGSKKKSKNERPVLVAVSSDRDRDRESADAKPSSSKGRGSRPEAVPAPASSRSPEAPGAAAREGSPPASRPPVSQRPGMPGAPRPKRELPPYLRVVK